MIARAAAQLQRDVNAALAKVRLTDRYIDPPMTYEADVAALMEAEALIAEARGRLQSYPISQADRQGLIDAREFFGMR